MDAIAAKLNVSKSTVSYWITRAEGVRLDRVDFADRTPGRAWNRLAAAVEGRIVETRKRLREDSVLGEYGAQAIQEALRAGMGAAVPARATINRVLSRKGLQDGARRTRRPPPPRGWYLPAVAAAEAELDSFDFIEDLKIANGPLIGVLTGTSLHGGLVDSWPLQQPTAKNTLERLLQRWQRDGLPHYAQFDNGTQFQGAHQFADAIGRVSRLCLALGVVPVFAPPREPGFQNAIESYNGLWQAKVWQRWRFAHLAELEAACVRYVAAHRARSSVRQECAPQRRQVPAGFNLDLSARLEGTLIYIRRADDQGRAHLLGRIFKVSPHWPNRLVRCEVNVTEQHIRFYGLRRRDPTDQPLLHQAPYSRKHKPFQGKL
jgi:transposase